MDLIKPHSVILFQGDSITDAGRNRAGFGANTGNILGHGYARLVADQLLETYPGSGLQIYNRGISGDRIRDLEDRWERDSLRLLPELISILIGVNDTWNYLFSGSGTSPEEFHQVYLRILQLTCRQLPSVHLVLCEPFLLITDQVDENWVKDLDQRRAIVRGLAGEFGASYVPFQTALDEAAQKQPPSRLLDDGVHPTDQGHRVLAECWLNAVKAS